MTASSAILNQMRLGERFDFCSLGLFLKHVLYTESRITTLKWQYQWWLRCKILHYLRSDETREESNYFCVEIHLDEQHNLAIKMFVLKIGSED